MKEPEGGILEGGMPLTQKIAPRRRGVRAFCSAVLRDKKAPYASGYKKAILIVAEEEE